MSLSRLRNLVIVGVIAAAALQPIASTAAAGPGPSATSAPSTVTPPGGGGVSWSDCIYDVPPLANSTIVDTYYNVSTGQTVTMQCGYDTSGNGYGVRHVHAGHGYDSFTDDCVFLVVSNSPAIGAGSGSGNLSFSYTKNGLTGVVIYSNATKSIVTAYVQGQNSVNWQQCYNALK